MPLGDRLPSFFPRWINIYDPRDFIAFIAEGVFGEKDGGVVGAMRVRDVEVNNRQPFPMSHISYWDNPEVWETIEHELGELA
ncbi:MAG: hypothetical protein WD273_04190 [Trueperaceae bacterium]